MTPLEQLQAASGSRPCNELVTRETLAWARAGDLVVGFVQAEMQYVDQQVQVAYDALDASNALQPHELWSVVLIITIMDDPSERVFTVARQLERDLRRSRKIVLTSGSKMPELFAGIAGHSLPGGAVAADVVSSALDQVATGELRAALDVLLKGRRSSEEVEQLISLLGSAP